ncbi:hypothetical protein ONZ45_g4580 [Pleurotus djamor]|nr:hypothetical protein ONZ45_g4580 [Pleurotus djamor]
MEAIGKENASELVHFSLCSFYPYGQRPIFPSNAFSQGAPRLRTLHLFNTVLLSSLPHLGQLTSLILHPSITSNLPSSIFIPSLQNTPRLERLEFSRLVIDADLTEISLPFLTNLSISSSDMKSSSLFNFLGYPASSTVGYACDAFLDEDESEFTGLTTFCAKLAGKATSSVTQLSLALAPGSFVIAMFTDHPSSFPHISISLSSEEEGMDLFALFSQLCHALPLINFTGLSLRGFPIEWNLDQSLFLHRYEGVEVLNLVESSPGVFAGLKGNYQRPAPLPQLRTILLKNCTIDEEFLDALSGLLTDRLALKKPVETLSVECCTMKREVDMNELAELVEVNWDGECWDSGSDKSYDDESCDDVSETPTDEFGDWSDAASYCDDTTEI